MLYLLDLNRVHHLNPRHHHHHHSRYIYILKKNEKNNRNLMINLGDHWINNYKINKNLLFFCKLILLLFFIDTSAEFKCFMKIRKIQIIFFLIFWDEKTKNINKTKFRFLWKHLTLISYFYNLCCSFMWITTNELFNSVCSNFE